MGFDNVYNLTGGANGWVEAGFNLTKSKRGDAAIRSKATAPGIDPCQFELSRFHNELKWLGTSRLYRAVIERRTEELVFHLKYELEALMETTIDHIQAQYCNCHKAQT